MKKALGFENLWTTVAVQGRLGEISGLGAVGICLTGLGR